MKKHISITIDPGAYELARRLAVQEDRSVSQVFERAIILAAESQRQEPGEGMLPSTSGRAVGRLSRGDAYGERV